MIKPRGEKPFLLTIDAFCSLGMVGIFHTVLGTALPSIRTSLEVDVAKAGFLGSASWLGFTSAVFFGGALSDIFERERLLFLACVAMGLSSVLLGRSQHLFLNCLLFGTLGAGTGMTVSSSSDLLIRLFPGKEGTIMNLHHFFYALGAMAGPLAMGYTLKGGWQWHSLYRTTGLLTLALAMPFVLTKEGRERNQTPRKAGGFLHLFKEKKMIFLIFVTLLGVGTQNGIYFWLVSFLKEIRFFSIFLASLGLSLFSAGMAAGRLLSGWWVSRLGDIKMIAILLILLNISLSLLIHVDATPWVLMICFMTGIACSGLFPGLLSLGAKHFRQWSGTAVGILGTAAGVGSSLMPWVMSAISQITSLKTGFLATHMAAALAFGLVIAFHRRFS